METRPSGPIRIKDGLLEGQIIFVTKSMESIKRNVQDEEFRNIVKETSEVDFEGKRVTFSVFPDKAPLMETKVEQDVEDIAGKTVDLSEPFEDEDKLNFAGFDAVNLVIGIPEKDLFYAMATIRLGE